MADESGRGSSWHRLSPVLVCARLDSHDDGLSHEEAAIRLERDGYNELQVAEKSSALIRFARQFHNVLLYVLLAAAAITAALTQWVDTGVIIGVVLINAIIGYLQEGRAEQALESIRKLLSPRATVLRAGHPMDIDARFLVTGDIVLIGAGDRVPADIRLSYAKNLEIDESILTGESTPVPKGIEELVEETPVSNRDNMAFAGTLTTRGQARGFAVETGANTELGQISQLLATVETLITPLLVKIAVFGRHLAVVILLLAIAIGSFGYFVHDLSLADMLVAAVSIAVAAIPEGLPPVITITLAIGVQLMARRHAIVRRLPAVETLGEVNVICTDKTGTLTTNEMTVRTVLLPGRTIEVTGVGYRPKGVFLESGDQVPDDDPALGELLLAGLTCNDSTLARDDGEWRVVGDPTEGALLSLAGKAALTPETSNWQRLDTIPFESERRFMATLARDLTGRRVIFAKGAPETILAMCEGSAESEWSDPSTQLAASGQRVLALARREMTQAATELTWQDIDGTLEIVGLVGVADPPRSEVPDALRQCHSAGIRVVMVTGDHANTAKAICRETGLTDRHEVVTGADLDAMSEAEFSRAAAGIDIFARVSPEQKLRLVRALQADDQVVAMTGDGVNDAPALKRADIGIAMGIKGTEAARQAAEIVLVDDNFSSIVEAVRQGRGVYDNIRKSIVFLLPTSVAEALVIAVAIVAGFALPMTPVQILWVNMITAVTLGVALAFEPAEGDVMERSPRVSQEPILSPLVIWRTATVSLLMFGGVLLLFTLETSLGASTNYARTVAVNALVVFEALYLLSSRRLHATLLSSASLTGNRFVFFSVFAVLFLQILFTYTWPLDELFATVAISVDSWLRIWTAGFVLLLIVEFEKWVRVIWANSRHRRFE